MKKERESMDIEIMVKKHDEKSKEEGFVHVHVRGREGKRESYTCTVVGKLESGKRINRPCSRREESE